jgi:hypothetical protein
MSMEAGLMWGIAILLVGTGGLTAFALHLAECHRKEVVASRSAAIDDKQQ